MKTDIGSVAEAELAASDLRRYLHERWDIDHATLEVVANGCGREEILGEWR